MKINMEPEFKIGNRKIGKNYKPFVIPEIGINHRGDINKAKQMIIDAVNSGAECVKFQMHIIEDEMSSAAKQVIPGHTKESIWEIINNCTLSIEEHLKLKQFCENKGILYLCTPFSRAAADKLNEMGVDAFKIGSGECNNYPLIKHIASFKKPIILSTGMNNLENISKSVRILEETKVPYALLHCTSLYPTPYEKIRLGALKEMQEAYPQTVIGLSDHSVGNYACFGAVALGASILEKHFTSDKSWPGPDISLSINPKELKELIIGANAVHESLGGKKEILSEEQPTIDFAYSSVVSIKDIKKGENLTKENIWVKRPGKGGILAEEFENILGKTAERNIPNDKQLSREDFK